MSRSVALTLLTGAACAASDEPVESSDPSVWLLEHWGAGEDDVAARVERLDAFASAFDPLAPVHDRVFVPGQISVDHRGVSREGSREGSGLGPLVRLGAVHRSEADVDDHRGWMGLSDRRCAEPTTWVAASRTFSEGEGCFADSACGDASARDVARVEWGEAGLWFATEQLYREVALADGRAAVLGRATLVAASVADRPGDALTERYVLQTWVPALDDDDATWRTSSQWIAAAFTSPDPLAEVGLLDRVEAEIAEGFFRADAWIDDPADCLLDDAPPPTPPDALLATGG
jgi:hypothetical protein